MTDWRRIGETDSPAQNPPLLSGENLFCWNWYATNIAGGTQIKLGLLSGLLAGLAMPQIAKEIFVKKISLICEMFERLGAEKE